MEALMYTRGTGCELGSLLSTERGGENRLCSCAAGSSYAETEKFLVDMGLLAIPGPSSGDRDRTCVRGRTCAVDTLDG